MEELGTQREKQQHEKEILSCENWSRDMEPFGNIHLGQKLFLFCFLGKLRFFWAPDHISGNQIMKSIFMTRLKRNHLPRIRTTSKT